MSGAIVEIERSMNDRPDYWFQKLRKFNPNRKLVSQRLINISVNPF